MGNTFTEFLAAVQEDNLSRMMRTWRPGYENRIDGWEGKSPLHFAAESDSVSAITYLSEKGANIESLDKNKQKPLHLAVAAGNEKAVLILVELGAKVECENQVNRLMSGFSFPQWKETPIHMAIRRGNIEIMKLLVSNVTFVDINKYMLLHVAVREGHVDIAKLLLNRGADIEREDNKGRRPIHVAVRTGDLEMTKLLISHSCDLHCEDKEGKEPIHMACCEGHPAILHYLITQKDAARSKCCWETPVIVGADQNQIQCLKMLKGAKKEFHMKSVVNGEELSITCEKFSIAAHLKNEICKQLRIQGRVILFGCTNIINDSTPIPELDTSLYYAVVSKFDQIERGEVLGHGAYGAVYKCKTKSSDQMFALKEIRNFDKDTDELMSAVVKEILVSAKISDHERLIRYDSFYEEETNRAFVFYIRMPLMDGGSLTTYLKQMGPLKEEKIIHFSKQILEGLLALHQHSIVHRDVKGPNILLDKDDNIKLCDYGMAKCLEMSIGRFKTSHFTSDVGTVNWMAPEVLIGGDGFEIKSDIWSFGATVVEMITGKPPYYNLRMSQIIQKIGSTKRLEYTIKTPISTNLQNVVNMCLNPDASKRPDCESLLAHIVFQNT